MNPANVIQDQNRTRTPLKNIKEDSGLDLQDVKNASLVASGLRKHAFDGRVSTRYHALPLESSVRSRAEPEAIPDSVKKVLLRLTQLGVSESSAAQLVNRMVSVVHDFSDDAYLWNQLTNLIQNSIPTTGPIKTADNQQRIVTLVGPTGVGKTTTIAKLSAPFRLQQRKRVGLITVDTFRVAAVEQLRTYAEIMDMPMEAVATPDEMRRAVAKLSDQELIFIDTAGRNPKNEAQIQQLKATVAASNSHEVHLVLSATCAQASLRSCVHRFETIGCNSIILTKVDEAEAIASLAVWLTELALPISYLTHGQSVPDDIRAANQQELANLMFGGEGAC